MTRPDSAALCLEIADLLRQVEEKMREFLGQVPKDPCADEMHDDRIPLSADEMRRSLAITDLEEGGPGYLRRAWEDAAATDESERQSWEDRQRERQP